MINSMSASGQAIARPGGGFGTMSPTANAQFTPSMAAPTAAPTPNNLPIPVPTALTNAMPTNTGGFTPQTQLPPVGGTPTPMGVGGPQRVQDFLANHPLAAQYFNNAGGANGIRDMIAQRLAARFPNGLGGYGMGGGGPVNTRFPIFNPGPQQPGGPVMQPLNATGG